MNKNSSINTIFTLVNQMIGGAMITLPIMFRQSGIFTGISILLISGLISYKTCRIYILHLSNNDQDIEDTIKRILGDKWEYYFKIITGVYLILLNIIYIELIVDQLYNVVYFSFLKTGNVSWVAQKDVKKLVFSKFSIQYLSLLCFLPLFFLTCIKKLSFLIRLSSYGVLSVFIYAGFILFEFISKISDIKFHDLKLFSFQFGNLVGTCAVAFTIHTVVATVMKANFHQQHNLRNLRISYILGFFLYSGIGVIGALITMEIKCQITIINCYLKQYGALMVSLTYFYGLTTVFPCFLAVGRSRLLKLFLIEVQRKHILLFNLIFMVISTFFAFFSTFLPLDLIMNLVGSVMCFFFVYLIPSKLHITCLSLMRKKNIINMYQDSLVEPSEDIKSNLINSNLQLNDCSHSADEGIQLNNQIRKVMYIFINIIGLSIGIFGIYSFINTFI